MRVRNWHAPPFVACLVAMLALVTAAFADSAGPPGVIANDAQYTVALATDTGQIVIADTKKITGADITSFVNVTDSIINRLDAKNVAYVYSGIVAGLQNSIVAPTLAELDTGQGGGDVICHHFVGQTIATSTLAYRVDYDLLC